MQTERCLSFAAFAYVHGLCPILCWREVRTFAAVAFVNDQNVRCGVSRCCSILHAVVRRTELPCAKRAVQPAERLMKTCLL